MSLHEFTFPSMCALLFLVNAHHGCVQTHHVMRDPTHEIDEDVLSLVSGFK